MKYRYFRQKFFCKTKSSLFCFRNFLKLSKYLFSTKYRSVKVCHYGTWWHKYALVKVNIPEGEGKRIRG